MVGSVTLYLSGEPIGTVDLLAGQDIERNTMLFVISKLGDFFSSTFFRVFLILSGITLGFYLVWFILYTLQNYQTHRRKGRPKRYY